MTDTERVTDKTLRAWLNAGAVDRGIGGGLTFVASTAGALKGQASWILRYRFGGANREKVLGRYPEFRSRMLANRPAKSRLDTTGRRCRR